MEPLQATLVYSDLRGYELSAVLAGDKDILSKIELLIMRLLTGIHQDYRSMNYVRTRL